MEKFDSKVYWLIIAFLLLIIIMQTVNINIQTKDTRANCESDIEKLSNALKVSSEECRKIVGDLQVDNDECENALMIEKFK